MNRILKRIVKLLPVKTKADTDEEKDYTKGMNKNLTTPHMDIVVKRLQGDTPVIIATFRAIQEKDRSFNLKIINEEFDFKDDLELTMNNIIDNLNYKLDLSKLKTDEEKIKLIESKINEQQAKIKELEAKTEGNDYASIGDVNIHDEHHRLNTLKILKHTVENKGKGSFEEVNGAGFRQRSYLLQDGTLIPYFHNSEKTSLYPHQAINRKIYKEAKDMIDRDYVDENTSKGGQFFKNFLMIATIGLLILNVWWAMENQTNGIELSEMATNSNLAELITSSQGSALLCAEYLAQQVESNDKLISYATDYLINQSTTEENIKEEGSINLG